MFCLVDIPVGNDKQHRLYKGYPRIIFDKILTIVIGLTFSSVLLTMLLAKAA